MAKTPRSPTNVQDRGYQAKAYGFADVASLDHGSCFRGEMASDVSDED